MAQVFSDIFYAIPRQPEITLVRFFIFLMLCFWALGHEIILVGLGHVDSNV